MENVYKVLDTRNGEILLWNINDILAHINQNEEVLEDFQPYTKDDWFDGWVEQEPYNLLSVNDNPVFGTLACKDMVEYYLIQLFSAMGMDIPENYEDIVQDCYEDVMACADPEKWHSGDVTIAFRRWIEKQSE